MKCKYFGIFEVYTYHILVDVGQLSEQYFNFIYYHQWNCRIWKIHHFRITVCWPLSVIMLIYHNLIRALSKHFSWSPLRKDSVFVTYECSLGGLRAGSLNAFVLANIIFCSTQLFFEIWLQRYYKIDVISSICYCSSKYAFVKQIFGGSFFVVVNIQFKTQSKIEFESSKNGGQLVHWLVLG